MDRDAPVILARERALRCVKGMRDAVTLRLEARVPPGLVGRAVVVEQRLTRPTWRGCWRRSTPGG